MTGILVVSFGTTFDETRQKNISAIEKEVARLGYAVYSAFTSNIIRNNLSKRGMIVDDISQAMGKMKADGITEVYVLPTYLLYGIEYENMMKMIELYKEGFSIIKVANPLLADTTQMLQMVNILAKENTVNQDVAIVFVGHGTEHFSNAVYPAMNYMAKEQGYPHIFVGAIEGYPMADVIVAEVKGAGYRKVLLTPLMLVAGNHAANDMDSEHENSWKSIFQSHGVEVQTLMKGLGEYCGVREMYIRHLREIM